MLGLFVPTNTVSWRNRHGLSSYFALLGLAIRFPFNHRPNLARSDLCRCFVSRQATAASAKARPGHPGARQDGNGLRVGPATRGQQEVPLSTGAHRREGSQRSLRTLKETRRRPFLLAGHQGLAAATGPGLRNSHGITSRSSCGMITDTLLWDQHQGGPYERVYTGHRTDDEAAVRLAERE